MPEQVKLPLLRTAAAHGAEETVPPPMMCPAGRRSLGGGGCGQECCGQWPARRRRCGCARRAPVPGSCRRRWTRRAVGSRLIELTYGAGGATGGHKTSIDTYHRVMTELERLRGVPVVAAVRIRRDRCRWSCPTRRFIATLVLSTRYRPLPVWLGRGRRVRGAMPAWRCWPGRCCARLPGPPVALVAAALFAMRRGGPAPGGAARLSPSEEEAGRSTPTRSRCRARAGEPPGPASWSSSPPSGVTYRNCSPPVWWPAVGPGCRSSSAPGSALRRGLRHGRCLLGRWLLKRVKLSLVRYVGATIAAPCWAILTADRGARRAEWSEITVEIACSAAVASACRHRPMGRVGSRTR